MLPELFTVALLGLASLAAARPLEAADHSSSITPHEGKNFPREDNLSSREYPELAEMRANENVQHLERMHDFHTKSFDAATAATAATAAAADAAAEPAQPLALMCTCKREHELLTTYLKRVDEIAKDHPGISNWKGDPVGLAILKERTLRATCPCEVRLETADEQAERLKQEAWRRKIIDESQKRWDEEHPKLLGPGTDDESDNDLVVDFHTKSFDAATAAAAAADAAAEPAQPLALMCTCKREPELLTTYLKRVDEIAKDHPGISNWKGDPVGLAILKERTLRATCPCEVRLETADEQVKRLKDEAESRKFIEQERKLWDEAHPELLEPDTDNEDDADSMA